MPDHAVKLIDELSRMVLDNLPAIKDALKIATVVYALGVLLAVIVGGAIFYFVLSELLFNRGGKQ